MKPIRNRSFLIRLIYAICLSGATYNHARTIATHGLDWKYGGVPVFICIFWTALTFIDPLAVVLLIFRPMLGLGLAVAIIVCDVAINSWIGVTYGFDFASFFIQTLFLIFVMSTIGIVWRAESGQKLGQRVRK